MSSKQPSRTNTITRGTPVECVFIVCQKTKGVFYHHFNNNSGNNNMSEAQKQRQNSFSHMFWQQLGRVILKVKGKKGLSSLAVWRLPTNWFPLSEGSSPPFCVDLL